MGIRIAALAQGRRRVISHKGTVSGAGLAAGAAGVGMVSNEWDQCDLAGTLDGGPERPLVFGTNTGAPSGLNFGPFRNEPPNLVNLFVVDVLYVLHAKSAHPAPGRKPAPGPSAGTPPTAGSAAPSAGAALWGSAWSSSAFTGHW